MADLIPGYPSLNIILSIITAGGVTSLLGIIFDQLWKKRAEYIDLVHKRIEKFATSQPYLTEIASGYMWISTAIAKVTSNTQLDYKIGPETNACKNIIFSIICSCNSVLRKCIPDKLM